MIPSRLNVGAPPRQLNPSLSMESSEFETIVKAWVTAQAAQEGSETYHENEWAIRKLINWSVGNPQPHLVWQFVIAAYPQTNSEAVLGMIAAGPLEDLLSGYGTEYIERVEALAHQDPVFSRLLSGVWRGKITDDVWNRLQKLFLRDDS
jgi:hypothetical protein